MGSAHLCALKSLYFKKNLGCNCAKIVIKNAKLAVVLKIGALLASQAGSFPLLVK